MYSIDIPAAYLILGNADSAEEAELLCEDSYRDRLARGLYKAVTEAAAQMGVTEE